jgi:hypothetical protein
MKTTIWSNGVLAIEPENSLEEYALSKWCKDNKKIFNHPLSVTCVIIDDKLC